MVDSLLLTAAPRSICPSWDEAADLEDRICLDDAVPDHHAGMKSLMPSNAHWKLLAWAHGIYFVGTGVWPLLHRASFEAVTGPKTDYWLVQTVGVLVSAIGLALLAATTANALQASTFILACGSALGLAAIDIVHVSGGRIAVIYLADAAVEIILIVGWVICGTKARRGHDSAGLPVPLYKWGGRLRSARLSRTNR
jgi:hypothetical protein